MMNNQNDQNNMNNQNGYQQGGYPQQGGYQQDSYPQNGGYQQNGYQQGYNYYDDSEGTSNYVNMYSDPERPTKKNGGKGFLKVVAAVAALAIVSVSSIEVYKLFGKDSRTADWGSSSASSELTAEVAETEAQTEAATSGESSSAAAAVAGGSKGAWITMAAPEGSLTIPEIVNKALPSVVGISSTFEVSTNDMSGSYWGFNFYGGNNYGSQKQKFTATGTGIVMSEDGYIITNAHCIYDSDSSYKAGKAVAVSVVMGDENETEYEAQIVGYDVQTDLAVLKIDATGLTPAEFGSSDDLQVGEMVVAIGNPLGFELFGTTTCGIVSALNRNVTIDEREMTLIQTDAAINSGNSGGPLLNGYGQVVGINSAKMSSSYSSLASGSASVEGLCFAIPISSAKDIINDLINNGYVTGRPQLGITGADITEADSQRFGLPQGVYVYSVADDSAAAEAGIRQGDVITEICGTTITTMDELNEVKNEHTAGETITLKIYRSGETFETNLTLHEAQQTN